MLGVAASGGAAVVLGLVETTGALSGCAAVVEFLASSTTGAEVGALALVESGMVVEDAPVLVETAVLAFVETGALADVDVLSAGTADGAVETAGVVCTGVVVAVAAVEWASACDANSASIESASASLFSFLNTSPYTRRVVE